MKKTILSIIIVMIISGTAFATQPTGKIISMGFYGTGSNEVIFVTIDPKASACGYVGSYVMYTQDRPAITAALIAAFQTQNTVTIFGTGTCNAAWSNYEEILYATFKK